MHTGTSGWVRAGPCLPGLGGVASAEFGRRRKGAERPGWFLAPEGLQGRWAQGQSGQPSASGLLPPPCGRDLKRDVAKKLEKLEKRTQRAIAELIRECRLVRWVPALWVAAQSRASLTPPVCCPSR